MGKKTLLRFNVGHRVVCRYGGAEGLQGGWCHGTVVKHWWCSCEKNCHRGKNCRNRKPYQIQLDNGPLIYSPFDTDECIQEPIDMNEKKTVSSQTHRTTAHHVKLKKYEAQLRMKESVDEKSIAEFLSSELSLKVGDRVQCKMGGSGVDSIWEHGFVVKTYYEEGDYVYPYSIRLDSGNFIYAPIDHEEIIKASDLPLPAGLLVEDDDPLFQVTSKHDVECAICCSPMEAHHDDLMKYQPCCGKDLCQGCIHSTCIAHSDNDTPCPFCRTPLPQTDEETVARLQRQAEKNNSRAISILGTYYYSGKYGLEKDSSKAVRLWLRAVKLGSPTSDTGGAFYSLGLAYGSGQGVEKDLVKAIEYWQQAAVEGHVLARYNVGVSELDSSPWRAYKHFMIAAKGGEDNSLKKTKQGYLEGFVTKDEFAETLRGYHKTKSARSTKHRDDAVAHTAYESKAEMVRK